MKGMAGNTLAYAVVIEKAGRNYSAYAPDLPGVITTGRTAKAIAFHLSELRAAREPIPVSTTRTTHIAAR
jgi:predicted RNase H-like HicB family nuclease